MRSIVEKVVENQPRFTLSIPYGAEFLSIRNRNGWLVLWYEADPEELGTSLFEFRVFESDSPISDKDILDCIYFDTVEVAAFHCVHVYYRSQDATEPSV